jgi:hypothetical protein
LINTDFLNTSTDNAATDVNSENTTSRVEENSVGKYEYGGTGK